MCICWIGDSSDEEGAIPAGREGEVDWGGDEDGVTGDEDIMRIMGFTGFDSTKVRIHIVITCSVMHLILLQGHQVEDNTHGSALGLAARNKRRIYRQYMNRRGEINKILLPTYLLFI
jgi:hypothetical protein